MDSESDTLSSSKERSSSSSLSPSQAIELVYRNNIDSRVNIGKHPYYNQNPYQKNEKHWPSLDLLFCDQKRFYDHKKQNHIGRSFHKRYTITTNEEDEKRMETATKPLLYDIDVKEEYRVTILSSSLLFNNLQLIMKQIPLYDAEQKAMIHPDLLQEIYNEITIAYFLNELLYGYKHVLSIHFMTIMDWFIARKETITIPPTKVLLSPHYSEEYSNVYHKLHQMVILEKADITLKQYLNENISAKVIKATLFQVFDALEVAWLTNEFIHHEPHMHNIMLKKIDATSPLRDKHFLYKREGVDSWYRVDKNHLRNYYIKIIDFGRSRMYTPSSRESNNGGIRVHNQLIEPPDYSHLGYSSGEHVNRHVDVYTLIFSILLQDEFTFWVPLRRDPNHREFFRFCDDILPFTRINEVISKIPLRHKHINEMQTEMYHYGTHNTLSLSKCKRILGYLLETDVFIYKHFEDDKTNVSLALNHAYFDEYKQNRALNIQDKETSIVVSFPSYHDTILIGGDSNNDVQVVDSSSGSGPSSLNSSMEMDIERTRCSICGKDDVRYVLQTADDSSNTTTLLCQDKLCYEFMHLFNSKTVFRI